MKKKVLTLMFLSLPFLVLGQFKTKKDTTSVKKESAEDKLDKAFDKAFGGLFKEKKTESATKSQTSEKPANTKDGDSFSEVFKGMRLGGQPKSTYSFASSFTMKITQKGLKDKQPNLMRIKYGFAADMLATSINILDLGGASKASPTLAATILDLQQKTIFTFFTDNGKKSMMAVGFRGGENRAYPDRELEKFKVSKTSQLRTILGYVCDGYLMESEKDKFLLWVSQKRLDDLAKWSKSVTDFSAPTNARGVQKNNFPYNTHPEMLKMAEQGRMVLGYSFKGNKGEETEMEFEEIKAADKSVFSTAGYKPMF
jgi:Domain of unknown function (DUF4412)